MKRDHITSEIIKASKAIRKKQLAMRMGQAEAKDLLEKQFKPITEPLQKILKTGAIKQEIDMDAIKSEISQEKLQLADDLLKLTLTMILSQKKSTRKFKLKNPSNSFAMNISQ
ncbi:hypothetical protein QE152_g22308 [Popillia japonica]|uniref:Uncharacterized protein n=1 Tax=Popillia japonica TaxID=7064 RepID=A0AAW1KKL2_POPJA